MTSLPRRVVGFAVVFVTVTLLGFVIHAVILRNGYLEVAHLHRTAPLFPWLLLANAAFTAGAVWLFHGRPAGTFWREGVTHGLKLWVFWPVPVFLIAYSSQPIPGDFVLKQILLELPDMIVIGLLIAALYGRRPSGR